MAVLLLIVVFVLAMLLLYFAGFIPGTVPQRYKQMFELADMSEEDASSFMDKICEDPDDIENYNETLLNIVRTVQRKDKEDESSNAQRLMTLGRGNCSTGNSIVQCLYTEDIDDCIGRLGECVMGDWVDGDCSVDCGVGTQTRTRSKIGGACIEDIEEEDLECAIDCTASPTVGGVDDGCAYEEGECIFPTMETSCGDGTKTRTRTVGTPPCNVPSNVLVSCNVPCPDCSYNEWDNCKNYDASQLCDDGYQNRFVSNGNSNCKGDQVEIRACNSCGTIPVDLSGCTYDASLSTYDATNRRFNIFLAPTSGQSCTNETENMNAKFNACSRFALDCNGTKTSGIFFGGDCFLYCANSQASLLESDLQ